MSRVPQAGAKLRVMIPEQVKAYQPTILATQHRSRTAAEIRMPTEGISPVSGPTRILNVKHLRPIALTCSDLSTEVAQTFVALGL